MIRLHWLLPDWEWQMTPLPKEVEAAGCNLQILSLHGWMTVRMATNPLIAEIAGLNNAFKIGLVRAGEVLTGNVEPFPNDGWFSPTYGVRIPALSLSMEVEITTSTSLMTEFIFPK
jgi:hypothetical protein